jgi:hypothetical protein
MKHVHIVIELLSPIIADDYPTLLHLSDSPAGSLTARRPSNRDSF